MAFEKMFLFTLILLIAVRDIEPQPATCADDVHCAVGYFCLKRFHTCHECLSCDTLGRSPPSIQNACIRSGDQCGPCLKGLINDNNWFGMCITPDTRSRKRMSSYFWILISCVTTAVLLSLFIVHGIWKRHIINVDIAMITFTKVKGQTELKA